MIEIIFLVLMFLAWAIGGEHGFGKGKRGFLLAVPMTLISIGHIPWYLIVAQVLALYCIYQALSYDYGIAKVYGGEGKINYSLGWTIIAANGALMGLTPAMLLIGEGHIWRILYSVVMGALGFCFVVRLSNDMRFHGWRHFLYMKLPRYPYLNFKDAWYVSEGLIGLILGMTILFVR